MSRPSMHKAVILARGLGTRMRRDADTGLTAEQAKVAETGVKALIPIDRPFLDYVLSALADAGYRHVCLVIGPEHEALREHYTRTTPPTRLAVDFAIQAEPKGTADAVAAAEDFAGDDPFLVLNSDNYYPLGALRGLRAVDGPAVALFTRRAMLAGSNIAAERITSFAVVETDEAGRMKRIIEKPDAATIDALPEPVGVSMNCWRFTPAIFEACRNISPSRRGELELPDAVQWLLDRGESFGVMTFDEPVLDMSSRDDIAGVAERLRGVAVRL